MFPLLIVRLPALIAEWRLLVLGVLLTGCGVGLLSASVGELVAPTGPADSAVRSKVAGEPIASRVALLAPVSSEAWSSPGSAARVTLKGPRLSADCLGAELATGQRAESMHLATVPVQRPADCGDVRDVLMGVASLPRVGRDGDGALSGSDVTEAALADTTDVDLAAAALYGPPDRQPQATQEALLEEGMADGGRGRARDYLEETAATRFLAP